MNSLTDRQEASIIIDAYSQACVGLIERRLVRRATREASTRGREGQWRRRGMVSCNLPSSIRDQSLGHGITLHQSEANHGLSYCVTLVTNHDTASHKSHSLVWASALAPELSEAASLSREAQPRPPVSPARPLLAL